MCVYLRVKFQVFSVILRSFRHRKEEGGKGNSTSLTSNRTPKKPTQTRVDDVAVFRKEHIRTTASEKH